MSVWTHIAGIVRFDTMRHISGTGSLDDAKRLVETGAPQGSELPIEFVPHENPMPEALAAYAISFHGDLRDFGDSTADLERIEKWLNGIADGAAVLRLAIRQMVVSAEVESLGTITWVAVTDGNATFRVRLVKTVEPQKE
jgi:hypothetical protein